MDAIVLIPLISGFGLLFWADMNKEEHPILCLMFQLMFIPLIFLTVKLGIAEATISYSSNADLVSTLADVTYYFGWLMFGIGAYYAFIIMGKAKDIVMQKRAERYNKKYGDD